MGVVEVLGLWPGRPFQARLSSRFSVAGKRATVRRSTGHRTKFLSGLRKITAVPRDSPLWVTLELKVGTVPALIDTGTQFSCIRSDVAEFVYLREEPCFHVMFCDVFHVKLLSFSWDHEFKVLRGGPFSAILGVRFLRPH